MTQQFARFISEDTVKFAPRTLKTPSLIAFNFNQNEELMRSQGYYPIVELNTREEVTDETHFARPQYSLIEAKETQEVNEEVTGEEGEAIIVSKEIVIDNSYITVTYVAEEIVDEGSDE